MRVNRFVLGALLLGPAALAAAPVAGRMQETPPPPRAARMKIMRDSTMRDSSVVRITINPDRVEQQIHDFMASKQLEATIGQALREAAGQPGDPKKMRELSEQLATLAKKNASLITSIEMTCAADRQPEGYIGAQFSMLQMAMGDEAPQAPLLREYPSITTVYPNSPASKAGVKQGDVVLLFGGADSRRPIQLDKVLKTGAKVVLRVKRDGAQKDLTLTVEKRPADYNTDCSNVDQVIAPEFDQPMVYMRSVPRARGGAAASGVFSRTPAAPDAPAAAMPPMPPLPPVAGYMYGFSTTNSAIAGATLMALDDGWRATLGVDNGVLVTKVLPGTPSMDSGLSSGDVIISADGQTVASVRSLSRIIANAKSNAVKLQIVRRGKQQVLVLRWQENTAP